MGLGYGTQAYRDHGAHGILGSGHASVSGPANCRYALADSLERLTPVSQPVQRTIFITCGWFVDDAPACGQRT
jgi:hypothetical protein